MTAQAQKTPSLSREHAFTCPGFRKTHLQWCLMRARLSLIPGTHISFRLLPRKTSSDMGLAQKETTRGPEILVYFSLHQCCFCHFFFGGTRSHIMKCRGSSRFKKIEPWPGLLIACLSRVPANASRRPLSFGALDSNDESREETFFFDSFQEERFFSLRFDMVAIFFLMYDLCITPVAIAWDFPMSGWLLWPGRWWDDWGVAGRWTWIHLAILMSFDGMCMNISVKNVFKEVDCSEQNHVQTRVIHAESAWTCCVPTNEPLGGGNLFQTKDSQTKPSTSKHSS